MTCHRGIAGTLSINGHDICAFLSSMRVTVCIVTPYLTAKLQCKLTTFVSSGNKTVASIKHKFTPHIIAINFFTDFI